MNDDQTLERVREMRAKGAPPKVIARALGMTPAEVAPLIRAAAATSDAPAPASELAGCWISGGWSDGLTVHGHPEWVDVDMPGLTTRGLAAVLVARRLRHSSKLQIGGFLIDVYCLGVKNALEATMNERELPQFVANYFATYDGGPLAVPVEQAQHVVFGAAEYARRLGFEPHPDFAPAADLLGPWTGPSDITFGLDGVPTFIQGPYDDVRAIEKTLRRSVGKGKYAISFVVG
ncbi:hypothetical protein [Micromonospora sp. CPCC 206061]|uniref:hypothetical protein n=1 Tax=Micromonospora sp. CPCC 206061 TaxID=3122410 RepID=UPI002FF36172